MGGAESAESAEGRGAAPRVVASDLDGTLLARDGSLTRRTREALTAVRRAGIETVFVTGRPPRWVDHLRADVGPHGLVLCGNGAFLYDARERAVLHSRGLEPEFVGRLVRAVRRHVPGAVFAAETGTQVRVEPAFLAAAGRSAAAREGEVIGPLHHIPQTVGKLLVAVPEADVGDGEGARPEGAVPGVDVPEDSPLGIVTRLVGHHGTVVTSGAPHLIEIGPPGVTKASALADFCADRRVAQRQVWAFGDALNDVPMLRWAGRGFAVGRAHPNVVAAASEHIAGPEHDGVAEVLEELVEDLSRRSVLREERDRHRAGVGAGLGVDRDLECDVRGH